MTIYPALTISLLSQLTDRELQSNYLNHLARTDEIASLLTQIDERNLVLRVINLALEVDLRLAAKLTASLTPELQQLIVQQIHELKIPIQLKIKLWRETKSRAVLVYLQDIFIFKHRYADDEYETSESAITAIIQIDRNLAIDLLIESLYDTRFHTKSLMLLGNLGAVEAIEDLGKTFDLNNSHIRYFTIEALIQIGTEAAIAKIRDALHHISKCEWSDGDWLHTLGIVAEPTMVEQLIYFLYDPRLYIDRSIEIRASDEYYGDRSTSICCLAIEGLEHIGGVKVFDWLHQAMYWIEINIYPYPFCHIIQALFRLDPSRTYTALQGAIQSYDLVVKKRAIMALFAPHIPISDCNLSILLNAIDDPDLDVRLEIVKGLRQIIHDDDIPDLTPELIDYAILVTKPILLEYINHPDIEIRDRIIRQLSEDEPDEREAIVRALGNVSSNIGKIFEEYLYRIVEPADLPILLEYLEHDLIEIRACAAGAIGTIGDDSLLPVLVKLIHDPEISIQKSALRSIVGIGSDKTFPILLELAANPELVADLIWRLNCPWDRSEPQLNIIKEFHKDRDFTIKFLETAERTLIELIRNSAQLSGGNIRALHEIGSDRSILPLYELLKASCSGSDDPDEDCMNTVDAIAAIGGDRSIPILLEFLANPTTLGGAIMRQFRYNGKLGVVPQLWSIQYQTYSSYLSAAILEIQEREGLYSPSFSDDVHPLFELGYPRLRDILLNCKG